MRKPVLGVSDHWRSDTNQAVQPQKMAKGLIFGIRKQRVCIIYVANTKVLISCAMKLKMFVTCELFIYQC